MPSHQVLARKYRPQNFNDVLGQEAIITTLKNAIKYKRLAHAYLFCGSRGTGKTTLARVFAKALNCQAPLENGEPCNTCSTCREITSGNSLDVLEIDGASHRGIDDIRQINETVSYAAASGKYKVYIIDEVHMLTKEAFNALLKTLEEPPLKVIFIFATTEPHKILPTILSRCQRFNLNRIPLEKICQKLHRIAKDLNVEAEDDAILLIAKRADGGLRDAESLLDQIIAFHPGKITSAVVSDVLGLMPRDVLFALDKAAKEGRLSMAFEIVHEIFSEGKDLIHFLDNLLEHFRTLMLVKLAGIKAPFLTLSESDKANYEISAKLYTQEQCQTILDYIIEVQGQIRFQSSIKIALETVLLRIMRIHQRLPIEFLVRRLTELEQALSNNGLETGLSSKISLNTMPDIPSAKIDQAEEMDQAQVKKMASPLSNSKTSLNTQQRSLVEDPAPTPKDLGIKKKTNETGSSLIAETSSPPQSTSNDIAKEQIEIASTIFQSSEQMTLEMQKQSQYDTFLHFAAIELEGTLQKNR